MEIIVKNINLSLLHTLTHTHQSIAATMYLPTHRVSTPAGIHEDKIRFKKNITYLLEILEQRAPLETDGTFLEDIKHARDELLSQQLFWNHLSYSMLICIHPGRFYVLLLPFDSDEYVALDNEFHLAPILGLTQFITQYGVLHITQKDPTYYSGDLFKLSETAINLPSSMAEALAIDEWGQKNLQYAALKTTSTPYYHGHGGAKSENDDDKHRYFRQIDDLLRQAHDDSTPLILAGTDTEIELFRRISKHRNTIATSIPVNNKHAPIDQLHAATSSIIQEELSEVNHTTALADYASAKNSTLSFYTTDNELHKAADSGRVGLLLLGLKHTTRDSIRNNMQSVRKLLIPPGAIGQHINRVALSVARNGGRILTLDSEVMPQRALAAATLRY